MLTWDFWFLFIFCFPPCICICSGIQLYFRALPLCSIDPYSNTYLVEYPFCTPPAAPYGYLESQSIFQCDDREALPFSRASMVEVCAVLYELVRTMDMICYTDDTSTTGLAALVEYNWNHVLGYLCHSCYRLS